MGVLKIITKSKADTDYLLNCFNYVIGGHTVPGCVGGINVYPLQAFMQMMNVKRYFGKTSGNQLVHFILSLDNKVFDPEVALHIAYEIAKYYGDRYQIIFGVHQNPRINRKGCATSYVHIHMIMNSVSFVDGKMYADNKGANYAFADHIKRITDDYNWKVVYGTSGADEED